jgi:hypothetical protein
VSTAALTIPWQVSKATWQVSKDTADADFAPFLASSLRPSSTGVVGAPAESLEVPDASAPRGLQMIVLRFVLGFAEAQRESGRCDAYMPAQCLRLVQHGIQLMQQLVKTFKLATDLGEVDEIGPVGQRERGAGAPATRGTRVRFRRVGWVWAIRWIVHEPNSTARTRPRGVGKNGERPYSRPIRQRSKDAARVDFVRALLTLSTPASVAGGLARAVAQNRRAAGRSGPLRRRKQAFRSHVRLPFVPAVGAPHGEVDEIGPIGPRARAKRGTRVTPTRGTRESFRRVVWAGGVHGADSTRKG